MNFSYFMPVKIIYGKGEFKKLKEYIDENTMVICDPFLKDKIDFGKVVFSEIIPNPPTQQVKKAVSIAKKENITTIVAIGGGSTIDTAKAVSCFAENIENKVPKEKKTKLIVCPTTSGTGSEVTNVGVYTFSSGLKMPVVTDAFWPDLSIVDPELTYSMPKSVTISTGLDAFTHAIESYWATSTQDISQALSLKAAKIIKENLLKSANLDYSARDEMSKASLIAGIAFSQTRTTAAHAISFPLTNRYGIPHGIACALTLSHLIEFVYENNKSILEEFLDFLKTDVKDLKEWIDNAITEGGFSLKLRDYGVKETELPKIVEDSFKANIIKLTPANFTEDNLMQILKKIF